ncbi:MAG: hypothetical protein K6F33_04645 [Bacteroidales bacterium]|nr:hypothetical protein [Bacteroidales bacterium]
MKISKQIYEFALDRIETLLPLVNDDTPADDAKNIELMIMSDIVITYEKEHYPMGSRVAVEPKVRDVVYV